jgi:Uma2 family endonuclease
MTVALSLDHRWTADEFIATDQEAFGNAWRYELVDGLIVAHAAPSPEHGAIAAALAGALIKRLSRMPVGCRPETGSAAAPRTKQRNTVRIPDMIVRCGEHPRVAFEVVSPSEIHDWRGRDLKRKHLQAVEGIQEIVELYQNDYAAHVYRLLPGGSWAFEAIGGEDAVLRLESVRIELPLAEVYALADLPHASSPGHPETEAGNHD